MEVQAIINIAAAHTNSDGSKPKIIVSTFIPVKDFWETMGLILYNNSLQNNLTGVDLLITANWQDFYDTDIGQAKSSLMADKHHPNATGYQIMAENWLEAIELLSAK